MYTRTQICIGQKLNNGSSCKACHRSIITVAIAESFHKTTCKVDLPKFNRSTESLEIA
jgi:hypothetical protein